MRKKPYVITATDTHKYEVQKERKKEIRECSQSLYCSNTHVGFDFELIIVSYKVSDTREFWFNKFNSRSLRRTF